MLTCVFELASLINVYRKRAAFEEQLDKIINSSHSVFPLSVTYSIQASWGREITSVANDTSSARRKVRP